MISSQSNQILSSNLTFINLNKINSLTENENIYRDNNEDNGCNKEYKIPLYLKYIKQVPKEYITDIWYSLKQQEICLTESFMNTQDDINDKMRIILIDWLVDVHYKFSLQTDTLFLAVNIVDRYTKVKPIQRNRYQLLGISALFIASKYEEILYPDLNNFVYITDNTYSKKEILAMERDILLNLGFDITIPTCYRFFEIIALNYNFNQVEFTYGIYLLEQFLIDNKMNTYRPSLIAISVCYIVMKLNNYCNYNELYSLLYPDESQKVLKECAKEIYYYIQNSENLIYRAVFNKYTKEKYYKVALKGMS
jgi:hypothetical protein